MFHPLVPAIDVSVVGQGFVGSHQVLFGQSSSAAGSHGSRDGRAERVGSVTSLLHDQGEGVRGLFLVVLGPVPSCQDERPSDTVPDHCIRCITHLVRPCNPRWRALPFLQSRCLQTSDNNEHANLGFQRRVATYRDHRGSSRRSCTWDFQER